MNTKSNRNLENTPAHTALSQSYHVPKGITLLVWLVFFLCAGNALLFMIVTASPHLRADVWRHLEEIVVPFIQGAQGQEILWSNHHPSPLLHLIQVVNLRTFGLRLDYDAYLGFFFQVITAAIFVQGIIWTYSSIAVGSLGKAKDSLFYLSIVLVIVLLFGFNPRSQYSWPLLTTVQYLYFFGILTFFAVDRCIRQPRASQYAVLACLALLFFFANMSYATVFSFAMAAALACAFLASRNVVYAKVALLLLLVWMLYYVAHLLLIPSAPYRPSSSMWSIIQAYVKDPIAIFIRLSVAISSGLFDVSLARKSMPASSGILLFFSAVMFSLFIAVFVVYLKKGLHKVTLIPLALMLLVVFFAFPALITRFHFIGQNDWYLSSPRYASTFKLAVIGAIWALLLIRVGSLSRPRPSHRFLNHWLPTAAMMLIVMMHAYQVYRGWDAAPSLAAENRRDSLAIFHASDKRGTTTRIPFRVSGHGDILSAIDYIAAQKLNVFSDNFPMPPVRQQIVAREHFDQSKKFLGTIGRSVAKSTVPGGAASAAWQIDGLRLDLAGDLVGAVHLRIKVKAQRFMVNALSIATKPNNIAPYSADLLRGVQNLYFTFEDIQDVVVTVRQESAILEAELRQ